MGKDSSQCDFHYNNNALALFEPIQILNQKNYNCLQSTYNVRGQFLRLPLVFSCSRLFSSLNQLSSTLY